MQAASQIDARTMTLQHLEALKALGASPSTRMVLPVDVLALAEHIGNYAGEALKVSPPVDPVA
jgi:hypothetical protein